MTVGRVLARLVAVGLVGWYVVSNGLGGFAITVLLFVLLAKRTV